MSNPITAPQSGVSLKHTNTDMVNDIPDNSVDRHIIATQKSVSAPLADIKTVPETPANITADGPGVSSDIPDSKDPRNIERPANSSKTLDPKTSPLEPKTNLPVSVPDIINDTQYFSQDGFIIDRHPSASMRSLEGKQWPPGDSATAERSRRIRSLVRNHFNSVYRTLGSPSYYEDLISPPPYPHHPSDSIKRLSSMTQHTSYQLLR